MTEREKQLFDKGREAAWDTPDDRPIRQSRSAWFKKGVHAGRNEILVFFQGLSVSQFKALTNVLTDGR